MKNNQGFTLIGLMAIAAVLSVITVTGISIAKYNASRAETEKKSSQGNRLISNVANGGAATLQGTGDMQFNPNLGTANNADTNTNTSIDPNSEDNPNHPNNPANPNYTGGTSSETGTGTSTAQNCESPCHMYNDECISSDLDCICLGYCPSCGKFVQDGPLNPILNMDNPALCPKK